MTKSINKHVCYMHINIKDMTQRDQICIAEEYTTSTGHCHTPSWLNPGEPSHTHIHLTTDRDSTQLNASPCMGNTEYSPTWTSPGRQGWRVDSTHTIFIHLAYNTL